MTRRRREEEQEEREASGGWRGRVAASGLGLFSSVCLEKEAGDGGDGDSCHPWPLLRCLGSVSVVDGSVVPRMRVHVYTACIRVTV